KITKNGWTGPLQAATGPVQPQVGVTSISHAVEHRTCQEGYAIGYIRALEVIETIKYTFPAHSNAQIRPHLNGNRTWPHNEIQSTLIQEGAYLVRPPNRRSGVEDE